LDSNFLFIGCFYSKNYLIQYLHPKIIEEIDKEKFIEIRFYKIYLKIHLESSINKNYELFYFKKSKKIKIRNLENSLFPCKNYIRESQQIPSNLINNKGPNIENLNLNKNYIPSFRSLGRKFLTQINNGSKSKKKMIQKDF